MTEVGPGRDGERARHAAADAFSMSGLLLEQAPPDLLVDARRGAGLRPSNACPRRSPYLVTDNPRVGETA